MDMDLGNDSDDAEDDFHPSDIEMDDQNGPQACAWPIAGMLA
jgi:hypothetical protein